MKKQFRITKNEEFQKIIKAKKFVSNPSFTVYYRPRFLEHSRIGISVGKKMGSAVVRNRIKRQVRMMCLEITEFKENYDCVIMVRNQYQTQDYASNLKALSQCFARMKSKAKVSLIGDLNEKVVTE